ncbi:hypothetical protein RRG08_049736 [Elysia crispata]|uniref:Uncharacterized protein n=1 Tax=Elysia crispata TaxID=231223 RepID=A0AAE1CUP0_9GAST|nr:hypothetical protein RRG08_049736 [Elysia crispata]
MKDEKGMFNLTSRSKTKQSTVVASPSVQKYVSISAPVPSSYCGASGRGMAGYSIRHTELGVDLKERLRGRQICIQWFISMEKRKKATSQECEHWSSIASPRLTRQIKLNVDPGESPSPTVDDGQNWATWGQIAGARNGGGWEEGETGRGRWIRPVNLSGGPGRFLVAAFTLHRPSWAGREKIGGSLIHYKYSVVHQN